jgi:hypothetical protein
MTFSDSSKPRSFGREETRCDQQFSQLNAVCGVNIQDSDRCPAARG